ncbi:monofunctional biosynthetic peptidoglycan transglycosylase [Ramlibacter sp. AN1015]|uniref:monofunctional biosynthetic peptidoglycan transglycosylase n=1 Tax=Ramlibacter sp. AN1015 TaxID=3133428 RepID=UPI0030C51206
MKRALLRWLLFVAVALLVLQLFFVLRIALMAVLDPQSTSFQRSEAWRLATTPGKPLRWRQEWVPYPRISEHLKRAVIASEDDSFVRHDGIDWDALEKAWQRNSRAEERAARRARLQPARASAPRVIGGSTITQQLAKNLFLSGERTLLRKGQEVVLTFALEALLTKERLLEIYLNSVEWGEGVFGAEAAAQRYYGKSAARLTSYEAARLAVMLPRPRHFERLPQSPYLADRAGVIQGRMQAATLP